MTATRVPPIPAPTDTNLRDVARAVKNVLDVREGLLGDPLDANVTFRDLKDGGIIDVSTVKRGGGSGTVLVTPPSVGGGSDYDPTTDLTTPPAPTGFTATGLFAAVKLSWAVPTTMRNYAYTEIWRSTTNVQGTAMRIGSSVVPAYTDYIGSGATQYYWVRIVSQANVTGPFNGTAGTVGAAAPDPAYLLEVLTGEITESQLFTSLGERIDQIDKPTTGLVTQVSQLNGQYTVKVDNNGYVAGFGLASTAVNGTPFSQFIVRADRFSISSPSGPGVAPATPFVVQTTAGVAPNGAPIPVGVYMDGAFIKAATINKAQIGSLYADRIEAGFTSSVDIESAKFYGSEFYIGGTATYEFNDTQRPTQKTGIAQVSNYNIALRPTGAEFDVGYFKIKNGATLTTPFEVVDNVVRITQAAIGTITANQIDSRNLTIKDSAGNVVFSADGGLGSEYLSGAVPGTNLLANTRFRLRSTAKRPFGFDIYNSNNIAFEWLDAPGSDGNPLAFGVKALATTSARFGLITLATIDDSADSGVTGGVYGGWKPNRTYLIRFMAKRGGNANVGTSLLAPALVEDTRVTVTSVLGLPTAYPYYATLVDPANSSTWEVVQVQANGAPNTTTTLSQAATPTATQLTVASATSLPLVYPYFITLRTAADATVMEVVRVNARVGNVLTVVRAQMSTVGRAWGIGQAVALGNGLEFVVDRASLTTTAVAWPAGQTLVVRPVKFTFGWNTGPASGHTFSNPLLTDQYQLYAATLTWGENVESDGALYLTMLGTAVNGDELHIDQLMVSEGDTLANWSPSERDAVSTLNPITPNNVGSYVGADAIGITQLGTTLQTTNFSATAGWQIKKDGTATFNSVKVRGEINGGAFTAFAWPTAGQSGFHLGPNGLALGNANDGKYFLVESSGNLYAPGLTIINGVLSIGQPNAVNTVNIAGSAVTVSTYAEGFLPTLTLGPDNVDLCGTSITINGLSAGQTAGTILTANIVLYEGGGGAAAILGTILVNGAAVGQAACTLGDSKTMTANAFVNLPNGTHTIQVRIRTAPESGGEFYKTITALGYITAISGKR